MLRAMTMAGCALPGPCGPPLLYDRPPSRPPKAGLDADLPEVAAIRLGGAEGHTSFPKPRPYALAVMILRCKSAEVQFRGQVGIFYVVMAAPC